ncbi:MAG: galactose ABC transporter substrate-binding protein [Oscillospiraceae bacterium]
MKKTLAVILSLFLTIGTITLLSSCGEKTDGTTNAAADVHVFYYTYSDTYISTVRSALDKELTAKGIKYQDYDGNGNQTTQTEQIGTAITKGAKAIIVNIVNTGSDDAAQGIVDQAKKAGIPVIFFNREVSDAVVKGYEKCVFVGTDAAEAGHLQGEMIGEYIVANYDKVDLNKDGKISYIMFKGEEGNNEAIYRTKFAVEDANKKLEAAGKKPLEFYDANNPNKYLVDKNGQWSAAASNEYMTTALTSFSDAHKNMIELVIANNDGMAEGAVNALSVAGYNTGSEKAVPVFGVDATDAAKELISAKKMVGTIKQDADGMAKAIALLASNAVGEKAILDGTTSYNIDENVAKIRIAYAKYLGETK